MKNKELIELFKSHNLTLGSAESLTCGLFASTIGEVSGASAVFVGGLVTYASKLKVSLLGVNESSIANYGVVSSSVAKEMALEARKKLGVDYSISFTGNAGPTTCIGDAPVGRVYIGISCKERTDVYQFDFTGARNEIRTKCVNEGIELLLKHVEK